MVSSAVGILGMLADLYGKTWEVVHGKSDSDALIKFLNSLDEDDARRVFSHCSEQVTNGNKWAPSLIEMIAYRDSPTESEYFMILSRVQTNKPEGRIEKYLCENIRYNLHRVAMGQELKFLKQQYRLAQELEKSGKLKTSEDELKGLPRHSVKNINDIKREEWESKNGRSLIKRIERIVRGES